MDLRARLAFDLGLTAHRRGDFATALSRFTEAHEVAPDWHEAGFALAHTYERLGRIGEALSAAVACLKAEEPSAAAVKFLCDLLENHPIPASFDPEPDDLARVLALDGFDLRHPTRLTIAVLKRRPPLHRAIVLAGEKGFAAAAAWALSPTGRPLIADEIFLRVLRAAPNTDPAVELLLSEIRRALARDPKRLDEPVIARFAESLAQQCALNEFVYFAQHDERDTGAHPLLARLYPPREGTSPRTTTFRDETSRRVAQQYEAHPFPVWHRINLPTPGAQLGQIRALQATHGLATLPSEPAVLIAGCGTGQQLVQWAAGLGPDARIVACDLSGASLAYAEAKADEYGLGEIKFRQTDILELDRLDERFDVIVCTGVLHHMRDPLQGWRRLTERLASGGIQRIGLYSARARHGLDEIRRRYPSDSALPIDERIRAFRRAVLEAHAFDWQASGIEWTDFFTLGGCRDLVFHAQETTYTLPRIAEELATLGLRFLDFILPTPLERAFAAVYPDPAARRDIALWDAFEKAHPNTFARMYQFWCAPSGD